MSHELRTPLNSLLILSRNLADNDGGNLDSEQVESARVIHESGSNLLRLINDILDLSKIEAGKMHAVTEDFPLPHFVQALLRRFKHVAGERGSTSTSTSPRACRRRCTPTARAWSRSPTTWSATRSSSRARARCAWTIARPKTELARRFGLAPDGSIAITVSDTGIGIPADKLDHIFGTFEQMDASTSRKYGGSGLGLAIARRLSELLGGGIAVESVLNEGSRFTVVLPEQLVTSAGVVRVPADFTERRPAMRCQPAPRRRCRLRSARCPSRGCRTTATPCALATR